jgi:hypothetical protein
MPTHQCVVAMARLVSRTNSADETVWIENHEGTFFYDAYFIQLQSDGERADLQSPLIESLENSSQSDRGEKL